MTTERVKEPKGHSVSSIFDIAPNVLDELRAHLEMSNLAIPVTQLLGWSQFEPHKAPTIDDVETTTSTTYVDLATEGPTLSGLPPGQYLVLFGFTGSNSVDGTATIMSFATDGAAISSDTNPGIVMNSNVKDCSVLGFATVTLSGDRVGGHELKAKYKVDGGTGTYFYRRLVAFKFANP